MVSEQTILAFQKVVLEEYGKELTLAEADEILKGAVAYFDKLAEIDFRPMPENNINGKRISKLPKSDPNPTG
jgi:hypothetical protein